MKKQLLKQRFSGESMVSAVRATTLLSLLALSAGLPANAQRLEDFGYRRMTMNGAEARGNRPLLVILAEFAGSPALAHDSASYDRLTFNLLGKSASAYFLENSHGRFYWSRAGNGVYGPFRYTAAQYQSGTEKWLSLALQSAAAAGFNFALDDANRDGTVTMDELGVLVVDNVTGEDGSNRAPDPACFKPPGSATNVCLGAVARVGDRASLMTITHELAHQLGTIEMYGNSGMENFQYTLMGATQFGVFDDRRTFHLDPWHKLLLGWVEPRVFSLDNDGSTTVAAAQLAADGPVILYSPSHGTLEYYLLEYRNSARANAGGFDADVPANGLVIWHVSTKGKGGPDVNSDVEVIDSFNTAKAKMISVYMNGGPSFSRGGGLPWGVGLVPYSLRWLNGLGREAKVRVGADLNSDQLRISWGAFEVPSTVTVSRKLLFYNSDQASGAVGSFDGDAAFNTLTSYDPGAFAPWTHISGESSEIVFYNAHKGNAAVAEVDVGGNVTTKRTFPEDYFGRYWTHLVRYKGYLFFYDSLTGDAAVGQFDASGFKSYNVWRGYFARNWTHIVGTTKGLLFYNAADGSGAVGDWDLVRSGTGFGVISGVNFKQTAGFGAGSLSKGWTHIVETSDGVLFYNKDDGSLVMADVGTDSVSSRAYSAQTIRYAWTHIVAANENILFYDADSGDAAVGTILRSFIGVDLDGFTPRFAGGLNIRRELPGAFSPGWTHILSSVDPTIIR